GSVARHRATVLRADATDSGHIQRPGVGLASDRGISERPTARSRHGSALAAGELPAAAVTRTPLGLTSLVLVLSGCSSSSASKPTPAVLLSHVGEGYHLSDASGPLSKDSLAVATAVPQAAMASYLSGSQLRSAGERIWTSATDGFVTDIVATFAQTDGAQGLVALAAKTLPSPGSQPFWPPGVSG